jgi:hypothetical protein
MDFKTYKPTTKVGGFKIRVDEYNGIDSEGGIDFHSYTCTKVSKDDNTELEQVKLAASINNVELDPEHLQVDDNGFLDETVNKLQRPNAKGERKWIVRTGTGMAMPGYGA